MDFRYNTDYKMSKYSQYNRLGDNSYDYARNGILTRCLPKIMFRGNPIVVSFIESIDIKIVMLLNYIDRLKHFKHISWYR